MSTLNPKVKKKLFEFIEEETKKALEKNDMEHVSSLQEAKRLISRGATKIRKANPYVKFMTECITAQNVKGGSTEDTHGAMQKCSLKWNRLSEEEKKKWRLRKFDAYDYS
jgi:hypothetical protein